VIGGYQRVCDPSFDGTRTGRLSAQSKVVRADVMIAEMFKFLLVLEDGEPWRILAIDTDIDDELVDRGINAVFTVEPV